MQLEAMKHQRAFHHADEATCAKCQTTETAVWQSSREDATLSLCNPCYIKKWLPSSRALLYVQPPTPPTPGSHTESDPEDLPTLEAKERLDLSWFLQYSDSESPAASLFVCSRHLIKEPNTIFVIQVTRAVDALMVAMNSATLAPHKILGLPQYNWGDNIDGRFPTPHIFGPPALAMKAVRRLQLEGVMLGSKHFYWHQLMRHHIVCSQRLMYAMLVTLEPLRTGKTRVRIKEWDSFIVDDILPDKLDHFFGNQ